MKVNELKLFKLEKGAHYIVLVSEYLDPSEEAIQSLHKDFKRAGVAEATFIFVSKPEDIRIFELKGI